MLKVIWQGSEFAVNCKLSFCKP